MITASEMYKQAMNGIDSDARTETMMEMFAKQQAIAYAQWKMIKDRTYVAYQGNFPTKEIWAEVNKYEMASAEEKYEMFLQSLEQ